MRPWDGPEICGDPAYWHVSLSVGTGGLGPERTLIPLTVYFCSSCVREIEAMPMAFEEAADLLEREPHLWRQVRAWFENKELGEPSRTAILLKFSRQEASPSSTRHSQETNDGSTQSANP